MLWSGKRWYEIINYGKDKIKDCLVVQLETSPTPLYKDEETFASTIIQLEKLGLFKKNWFDRWNNHYNKN